MGRISNKNGNRVVWLDGEVKMKSKRTKLGFLISSSLLILFLIGGSLFYVWSRIQVIQLGYEISNTLKEERALIENNKRLRLEVAMLKSYARIERIAIEELGMKKPSPNQVILIK